MSDHYDFGGYATRNDLRCADGRTIRKDAFKDSDGMIVPLVWQHQHNDPGNVLGHALLENRADGVYTYGKFNDTEAGQNAKQLVEHGDVRALSIYANQLKQHGGNVLHGMIREVSLVLAGANPGAYIDTLAFGHSDDEDMDDGEAVVYTDEEFELFHSSETPDKDNDDTKDDEDAPRSIQEVLETMTDEQLNATARLVGLALEQNQSSDDEDNEDDEDDDYKLSHSDSDGEEKPMAREDNMTVQDVLDTMDDDQLDVTAYLVGQAVEEMQADHEEEMEEMAHNLFEMDDQSNSLTHADVELVMSDAQRIGSLREAINVHSEEGVLAHAIDTTGMDVGNDNVDYGMNGGSFLFPDAKLLGDLQWIRRDVDWVKVVNGSVHRSPFSRIKSVFANLTEDEARAKGYIKGRMKKDEVFTLLKRVTSPKTIYKKQRMDRDDIADITDFDVVAKIKDEMRDMLDEEIARAILIGDGRNPSDADKIDEQSVRPIATDYPLFSIQATCAEGDTEEKTAKNFIKAALRARKDYKGSGNPTLFTTEDVLTSMLLIEDTTGRAIYKSESELATALRVSSIVTVPVMENITLTNGNTLMGIIVNLKDYNVGADKGASPNLIEDFDIDYNQYKYLIETRISGALVKPFSAIVISSTSGNGGAGNENP